jgi:hypothetical protein
MMNRTIAAAATFAAALGLASLAQAQTNPPQTYDGEQRYETPGKPSAGYQAAPSAATSPAAPNAANPYWRTYAPGTTVQQRPGQTN